MFEELVSQITRLLGTKLCVIVAISGFGGSGKSTLADKLRNHFGSENAFVLQIDQLYSENPMGPEILDQTDWKLLKTILSDAQAGKKLQFQGRSSSGRPVMVDEELPKILIIEGVKLLQPELTPSFDVSVWIDCPQELALKRAKARDREQGESEEVISEWDTHWGPIDKMYFDTYKPYELADFVYREYSE